MATYVAETKAQLSLRTPYGHSSRFTAIFLFLRSLSFLLLLSQAVTVIFIHHLAKLLLHRFFMRFDHEMKKYKSG